LLIQNIFLRLERCWFLACTELRTDLDPVCEGVDQVARFSRSADTSAHGNCVPGQQQEMKHESRPAAIIGVI